MGNFVDLTGETFGRLTVFSRLENDKHRHSVWRCICSCGEIKDTSAPNLKTGRVKSCGCLSRDRSTTHGMTGTRVYGIWNGMTQRCGNPNDVRFPGYGGRGIIVCDRWLTFENFYEDMGEPADRLSIDRINNDKGYSLDNCRWATKTEQCRNQRIRKTNKSGCKGVCLDKTSRKWRANIGVNGKRVNLGYYEDIEEAIKVRKLAEKELWI